MRVLLDEMLPRRLKRFFRKESRCHRSRARLGLQEGRGVADPRRERVRLLLTTDRGIPHQQDLSRFDLKVVVLTAKSNRLSDLEPRMDEVGRLIEELDRNR